MLDQLLKKSEYLFCKFCHLSTITKTQRMFTGPQDIAALNVCFIRFNLHNLQSNFSAEHLPDDSQLKPIQQLFNQAFYAQKQK